MKLAPVNFAVAPFPNYCILREIVGCSLEFLDGVARKSPSRRRSPLELLPGFITLFNGIFFCLDGISGIILELLYGIFFLLDERRELLTDGFVLFNLIISIKNNIDS